MVNTSGVARRGFLVAPLDEHETLSAQPGQLPGLLEPLTKRGRATRPVHRAVKLVERVRSGRGEMVRIGELGRVGDGRPARKKTRGDR